MQGGKGLCKRDMEIGESRWPTCISSFTLSKRLGIHYLCVLQKLTAKTAFKRSQQPRLLIRCSGDSGLNIAYSVPSVAILVPFHVR